MLEVKLKSKLSTSIASSWGSTLQMVSTETPPGPSCSCKPSSLRTDDMVSGSGGFEVAESPVGFAETQAPNFSIRDHVFKSRSKDIAANWPFPQQFLQICLKHGVRDPLPPFEPLELARGWCCRKAAKTEQPVSCSEAYNISAQLQTLEIKVVSLVGDVPCNIRSKTCLPSDELVVGCSDRAQYRLSENLKETFNHGDHSKGETSFEGNAEIISTVTKQDQINRCFDKFGELLCSEQVTRTVSEESSEIEAADILCDPSKKKRRLLVKLSSITEISRTEDKKSNSSTMSDPLASKVCPVCKIYTSTSNTTLNAHIDQCLCSDYTIKPVVTEVPKSKVKPVKKRLMVDIYATASHCTLEDLDRRNGTEWASKLASGAPTTEARVEFKRPKLSAVDIRIDERPTETSKDRNEGPVYVDSNGIKLRILSKFSDTLPVTPKEHLEENRHEKLIKADKSFLNSNKKCIPSTYPKFMKMEPQHKKRNVVKSSKSEIQVAPRGDCRTGTRMEKEESPSEVLNARSCSVALKHWVCSKRSDLPRKFNHKEVSNSRNSDLMSRNLPVECNGPNLGIASVVKSDNPKRSKPLEDLTYSQKTKRVTFLSNNVQTMEHGKNPKSPVFNTRRSSKSTLTGHVMTKSSSLGTPNSSPERREEIHISTTQKPDNSRDRITRSPESSSLSLKTKAKLKNALFGRPFLLEGSKGDVSHKLSQSKISQEKKSILETIKQGELPSDVKGLSHTIKTFGLDAARTTPRSDLWEGISGFTTEETMDLESPISSIYISELEDGEEPIPSQIKAHCKIVRKSSKRKADGDLVVFGNSTRDFSTKLGPWPSEHVNGKSIHGSVAPTKTSSEIMRDEEEVQNCNLVCDGVVRQSLQSSDEVGLRGEEDTCTAQFKNCQAETATVQEPGDCLTCYEDVEVPEFPQENSSITSTKTIRQDRNMVIDREPSTSPVSAISTISPFLKDSECMDPVSEPLMRTTVQEGSDLTIPCVADPDGTERRTTDRRYQDIKDFIVAKEPDKILVDQPCPCLRRGGLAEQSKFLRQHTIAGRILPYGRNQVSNSYIFSSFKPDPGLRTDTRATTNLDSPDESIIMKSPTDVDAPSLSSWGHTQSTSNSVLRLMGKNLMVAEKGESARLAAVYPEHNGPNNPSNARCLLPPASATSKWECLPYHHHQLSDGSAVFDQASSMVSHQMSPCSFNVRAGSYAGFMPSDLKMKSPPACNMERTTASHQHSDKPVSFLHANLVKEVIVIDESLEPDAHLKSSRSYPDSIWPARPHSSHMQWKPFSCYHPEGQFLSRDGIDSFRHYSNAYPWNYTNTMSGQRISQGSDPRLPELLPHWSPLVGHSSPPFYHYTMERS